MTERAEGVIVILLDAAGRFLLGRRSAAERSFPGYWLPVAGTVEPGETEVAAVVRESLEEAGLVVRPTERIRSLDTTDGAYRLHYWLAEVLGGDLRRSEEHDELRWVDPDTALALAPIHDETREVLAWILRERAGQTDQAECARSTEAVREERGEWIFTARPRS